MTDQPGGGLGESRDWLGSQGLMRPREGRAIAGVCAGLANRFGIPVLMVRLAMVFSVLVGPGILIYPALWLLMPAESKR